MALHYTNRRGSTYYLHRRKTKNGKVRYVFAKSVSDGALDALPDGYQVRESINGVVSVVSLAQARLITELEEQAVRSAMAELDLHEYRLEIRGNAIIVFEPDRRVAERSCWRESHPSACPNELSTTSPAGSTTRRSCASCWTTAQRGHSASSG